MEVKRIVCPKGHSYDATAYKTCPVCANEGTFPKTAPAAGGAASAFPKTEPVGVNSGANMAGIGQTVPANNYNAGGMAPQFQPTIIGPNAAGGDVDPVVGWLVCIDGALKGVDFRLHDGYNYIGREVGDIHIGGDQSISREKHACVSFYSKRQTFYIAPVEGRNIIELNDEPVITAAELKNYDVITIGSTKLLFIAMCGPRFSWTEGVANE